MNADAEFVQVLKTVADKSAASVQHEFDKEAGFDYVEFYTASARLTLAQELLKRLGMAYDPYKK